MGFCERSLVLEPELLVVGKVRPSDVRRFLLSDNCSPVAISLSSNHSLRASLVYSSTEVGWLLSLAVFSRSNAFLRVFLSVPVFSLICLAKNS